MADLYLKGNVALLRPCLPVRGIMKRRGREQTHALSDMHIVN